MGRNGPRLEAQIWVGAAGRLYPIEFLNSAFEVVGGRQTLRGGKGREGEP